MDSKEFEFKCANCGSILFKMDVTLRASNTGVSFEVTPDITFRPENAEVDVIRVTNSVRIGTCETCQEKAAQSEKEKVGEEVEVPVEETLKKLTAEIHEECKRAETLDEMLGDTLQEIVNSAQALQKCGAELKSISSNIKKSLEDKIKEVMDWIETFTESKKR